MTISAPDFLPIHMPRTYLMHPPGWCVPESTAGCGNGSTAVHRGLFVVATGSRQQARDDAKTPTHVMGASVGQMLNY